jgi:hypothetical protein
MESSAQLSSRIEQREANINDHFLVSRNFIHYCASDFVLRSALSSICRAEPAGIKREALEWQEGHLGNVVKSCTNNLVTMTI